MKKRSKKLVVCALALAALFAYVGNDFTLVNIGQTAAVTALGVDVNDGGYEISAQISMPKSNGSSTENQQKVLSAQGKTVGAAIALLGKTTGWYLKMSFCSLVVLSEEAAKKGVLPVVDYFVKDTKMQDAAYLTACCGKAKDVLSSTAPLDSVSAFALGKTLQFNGRAPSGVNPITVKEFAQTAHGKGKCGYMPFLFAVPADRGVSFSQSPQPTGLFFRPEAGTEVLPGDSFLVNGGKTEKNGGSSQESGSQAKSGEQAEQGGGSQAKNGGQQAKNGEQSPKEVTYDGASTLLFLQGKAVALLDGKQSLPKSLLTTNKGALLPVYGVEEDGEKTDYMIAVVRNKSSLSVAEKEGALTVTLKIRLTAKVEDENGVSTLRPADRKDYLPPAVKKGAEEQLAAWAKAAFLYSAEVGSDFFGVRELLFQKDPAFAARLGEDGWKNATFLADVRVSPLR